MEINTLMVGDWVYRIDFNSPVPSKIIGMEVVNYDKMEYVVDVLNKNGYNVQLYLNEIEPIPLTKEILKKNGFNEDAFTNLSPDYYYHDNSCSCCINLNSTCDKSKSIFVENTNTRISASIEELRHSLTKKPLYVHQLQHLFRLCGIDKEIEL